jgi:hypothetical protein
MSTPLPRALLYLTASAIGVFALADGGGPDPVLEAARRAFGVYQNALFAGDRGRLREVLATGSRQVLPHIPFERARTQQRLTVVGAVTQPPQVLLTVEDPNQDGRRSTFVMVKEDGELRLDLVATTAYNHEERPAENPGPQIVPRELDPHEIARIRSRSPESFR